MARHVKRPDRVACHLVCVAPVDPLAIRARCFGTSSLAPVPRPNPSAPPVLGKAISPPSPICPPIPFVLEFVIGDFRKAFSFVINVAVSRGIVCRPVRVCVYICACVCVSGWWLLLGRGEEEMSAGEEKRREERIREEKSKSKD